MILFIVFLVVIAFWVWPFVWFWLIQASIEVEVHVDSHVCEIGDVISLRCTIRNRAWLPCPSFLFSLDLPEGLEDAGHPGLRLLRLQTSLRAREAITAHAACRATRRGFQTFANRPAVLILSEGFGLRRLVAKRDIQDSVSVYPAVMRAEEPLVQLQTLVGSLEKQRWLHPDESMLRGIRAYHNNDAFKHIAWNASASAGEWMVKQFSTSTEANVHLVLNAQFYENSWYGTRPHEFDSLCSMLFAVAGMLEQRGFQLQFSSNAALPNSPGTHHYGQQSAAGIRILLAQLQPFTKLDFADLWAETMNRTEANGQVLVFTSYLSQLHQTAIDEVGRHRHVSVVPGPGANFEANPHDVQNVL